MDPVNSGKQLAVLIIDDEKNIRATLSLCLEQMGCQVTTASSQEGALMARAQQPYELAFLDLRRGESNGLDLIPKLLAEAPNLAVVVITAYSTVDSAVAAIKRGATNYLPKPFTPAQGPRRSLSRKRFLRISQRVRARKRRNWAVTFLWKISSVSIFCGLSLVHRCSKMQQRS